MFLIYLKCLRPTWRVLLLLLIKIIWEVNIIFCLICSQLPDIHNATCDGGCLVDAGCSRKSNKPSSNREKCIERNKKRKHAAFDMLWTRLKNMPKLKSLLICLCGLVFVSVWVCALTQRLFWKKFSGDKPLTGLGVWPLDSLIYLALIYAGLLKWNDNKD